MGISLYSVRTYFVHQSKFLFPAILTYWERYRATPVNELKEKREVIWCEDERFDSMGHSAKYRAYTMFCCALAKIIHFKLIHDQVHQGLSQSTNLRHSRSSVTICTLKFGCCAKIVPQLPVCLARRNGKHNFNRKKTQLYTEL